MKKIVLAAAISAAASTAFAGNPAPAVVEPVVVEEQAGSSASGVWVPLALLAVIAAVAVSNN